jgi:putative redox protein
MMATELTARVVLQDGMRLTGKAHSAHEVQIDYTPPLGTDDGFTSLELLMVSLASCSASTTLSLLRRMEKTVASLEVQAVGQRRDEHPTVLTDIELRFSLKGDGLDAPSVEKAIALSETHYCPVWAMLKPSVAITWKYTMG